jgi:hypothetical protein
MKKKLNVKKVPKKELKKVKGGRIISDEARASALKDFEANSAQGAESFHINVGKVK